MLCQTNMTIFQLCVLLMANLVVKGDSKIISCYVCDDCDVLDECLLQSCPLQTTTPKPTTTPIIPTLPPSPPGTSTATMLTTRPSTSTKPATTATTEPPPTTVPTPLPTTESTSPVPETTISSSTTETANQTTESTVTEPTEVSTSTPMSTTHESLSRTSKSDVSEGHVYMNKSIMMHHVSVSYHCYSIDTVENNKRKKKRGCVEVPESKSACEVLRDQYGCSAKNCKACSEDRCNRSGVLQYSPIAFAIVIGATLF